jgi:stage II sporulation SpoE-like protein
VRRNVAVALRYYRTLPGRTLAGYLVGVFLIFAALGVVADMRIPPLLRPFDAMGMLVTAVANGLIGVLFALGPMRSYRWFFPIAFAFMAGVMFRLGPFWEARAAGWPPADMETALHRLVTDGWWASGLVVAGFVVLVLFIRTEGIRQSRLRTEIDLAHDIHASLVPPVALEAAGCEVRGLSIPSTEVGGDLADAYAQEDRLIACVADVAGHGVPAGALMAMVKSAVRLALPGRSGLETLFAHLNQVLVDLRRPDRFVTLACLRFDGSGTAEYALAGHFPILRVAAGTRTVERLENAAVPLGIQAGARFTAGRVPAAAGDLFVCFTDGLIEVRDPAGQELGMGRVEALVAEHATRSLIEIERAVFGAARQHGPQLDDQTLVLVRMR